ncbi:hypothetical protein [Rhizobium alvei]|uniref:Fibronectin-binding protein n=1 Tax=Rhizobium alvei TaxID=1132659 RepID=A0ABT8YHD0_9HYPH|nr:hypothetical protein [Rhizobium alvei]MDO6963094.1 hypothetical protein [Rhizobium alvei]
MRRLLFALALLPAPAFADPVGKFTVHGSNLDGSNAYEGTVSVKRTGATYSVTWNVEGTRFTGTAVGAKTDTSALGAASEHDSVLSVIYRAGKDVGTALFFEVRPGEWRGIWAYEGTSVAALENWQSEEDKTSTKALTRPKGQDQIAPAPGPDAPSP